MMRGVLLFLCIALPGGAMAQTEPGPPVLTVEISPADAVATGVHVGEEIVLRVLVASKTPFEGLEVTVLPPEGADLEPLTRPRTRAVRSYAGDAFVHERHVAVYPTRSGVLVLPGVRAAGDVAGSPGGEDISFSLESPEHRLSVLPVPVPGEDRARPLVARGVTVEESWSVPLDAIRFGDVVRRSVTVTATGARARDLPELPHAATQRVLVLPGERDISESRSASGTVTVLTQSWDLRVEGEVVVYFPPVGVEYLDPVTDIWSKALVPGHRVEPLPADGAAVAMRLMAEAQEAHRGALLALAIVAGLLAAPFIVVGAAFAVALCPAPADRRLGRDLAVAGPDPGRLVAAVEYWRRASGLPEQAIPQEVLSALFGSAQKPPDCAKMRRSLIGVARENRLSRVKGVLGWLKRITLGELSGIPESSIPQTLDQKR